MIYQDNIAIEFVNNNKYWDRGNSCIDNIIQWRHIIAVLDGCYLRSDKLGRPVDHPLGQGSYVHTKRTHRLKHTHTGHELTF